MGTPDIYFTEVSGMHRTMTGLDDSFSAYF